MPITRWHGQTSASTNRLPRVVVRLSFRSTLLSLGGRYYFDSVQLQPCSQGGGKSWRLASRDRQYRQHDEVRPREGGDGPRRGLFQLRYGRLRYGRGV